MKTQACTVVPVLNCRSTLGKRYILTFTCYINNKFNKIHNCDSNIIQFWNPPINDANNGLITTCIMFSSSPIFCNNILCFKCVHQRFPKIYVAANQAMRLTTVVFPLKGAIPHHQFQALKTKGTTLKFYRLQSIKRNGWHSRVWTLKYIKLV